MRYPKLFNVAKCDIDKVWEAIGLATEYLEKVN